MKAELDLMPGSHVVELAEAEMHLRQREATVIGEAVSGVVAEVLSAAFRRRG